MTTPTKTPCDFYHIKDAMGETGAKPCLTCGLPAKGHKYVPYDLGKLLNRAILDMPCA